MNATAVGVVQQIGAVQELGTNGFKKREIILKTIEEYPNFYNIEFHGGNSDLLNAIELGSSVKITLKIRGREYTNPETKNYTVFHALVGWEIEGI